MPHQSIKDSGGKKCECLLSMILLIVYLRLFKKLAPMTGKMSFLACYKMSVYNSYAITRYKHIPGNSSGVSHSFE